MKRDKVQPGETDNPVRGGQSIAVSDFRLLFESAPDPCLVLDRALHIVAVNEAYLKVTTTKRGEIIGRWLFEVFPDNPDDPGSTVAHHLSASLDRVLKLGLTDVMPVQKYDIRNSLTGGGFEERYWSPVNTPVRGADGEIAYILHRVQDVTAFIHISRRKQAEQEREEALLQLESVLESINEGVVISDLQGNVLKMNREAFSLHEFGNLKRVRQHMSEYSKTFTLFSLQRVPIALDEWPLARALRGERFFDYELIVHHNDSGKEMIASYSGTPVYSKQDEKPILAVLTLRDIGGKKRMEEALAIANSQLQIITDNMPVGVTRCDQDRRYRWVSPEFARWLGLTPDKIAGHTIEEIVGKEAYETLRPYMDRVLTGQRVSFETRLNYRGLGSRWISATYIPTYGSGGVPDGWVAAVIDITRHKDLEAEIAKLNANLAARVSELEEANQELEAFNRMVSHDLRQPLNTIGTSFQATQMLCGDKIDPSCSEFLKTGYDTIFVMNNRIEALLKFSRSTHGILRRDQINLSEMAQQVASEVRLTAPDRRATFTIAEGLRVYADRTLLRSVLENLIGNAWKYTGTRAETHIEVGAMETDGQQVFFVRDNGKGFDTANAADLFTPFKRLPGAEEFRGFGIGLATVDRIIRRHGGRIWADGAPGKGATFYFTLPADEVASRTLSTEGEERGTVEKRVQQ